jgi:hypothetical protein
MRRYRKLGTGLQQLKNDVDLLRAEIKGIHCMLEDILNNKKYKIMLVNLGEINENSNSDPDERPEMKRSLSR